MTPTSPPDWTTAILMAVRRQLREVAGFGAVLFADQVDDVLDRLDARRRRQFRGDGLGAATQPLKFRAPIGCQGYRQAPR